MNFKKQRKNMVRTQIKARGITDKKVLKAFENVKRHLFVPESKRLQAYADRPLAIGSGQTISQPYIVALMVSLLNLGESDNVLEIGTGSGYQTAILCKLAKKVYSIERYESLAKSARKNLEKTKLSNYEIKVADGTLGWPENKNMKFDAIIVSAAANQIPKTFKEQLAMGGRLVIPVGSRFSQNLIRLTKKKDGFEEENFGGCVFVPLIGKHSW
ncbi:MAG: protein-L-isoaspartate(D-aspartate) O-methyltransferase [Candidatus Cloacimonetes bacterium]|nr:protein-L-isoaspartate(D-aspartate) O-methyltransferase [Candidatus Cloacimonadota bacterium]MBS3767044.1 protein-L-isoaspartate(D-aspartate) O-methyltransferase [Candidatus Cloacimonadota bacterium]